MRETNIFILIFLSLLLLGCGKEIPVMKDLIKSNYKLIDKDSPVLNFR